MWIRSVNKPFCSFLSDNDVCTYVRWMSDYSNLNDMIGHAEQKVQEKRGKYMVIY